MPRSRLLGCLTRVTRVALAILCSAAPAGEDNRNHEGPAASRWRVAEIDLTSSRTYANPYGEIDVTVTFTGPGGESVVRPAFWDGGSAWKVRFAPTAVGSWRWHTECSDRTNDGLHEKSGRLECVPGQSVNPCYRHGFLQVSDNRRHFVHADGTPFFWLGDTHWQMPDTERMDACNHPEHAGQACPHGGQFQHLVADRRAKGFTVYQTYPSATNPAWWTAAHTAINPQRFRDVFDVQMNHLAEQGFVIALGFGHFNNSTRIPVDDLRRWARYLVARYGAHPVVWITCQEMNAPEDGDRNRIDVWRAVAEEIQRTDGYGHPHSGHQWVLDVRTRPLGNEPPCSRRQTPPPVNPCRRLPHSQVVLVAAPGIFLRPLDDPCPRRIQVNVARPFHGVGLPLHEHGLEPPLEQRPAPPQAAVEAAGVSRVQIVHPRLVT